MEFACDPHPPLAMAVRVTATLPWVAVCRSCKTYSPALVLFDWCDEAGEVYSELFCPACSIELFPHHALNNRNRPYIEEAKRVR